MACDIPLIASTAPAIDIPIPASPAVVLSALDARLVRLLLADANAPAVESLAVMFICVVVVIVVFFQNDQTIYKQLNILYLQIFSHIIDLCEI